VASVFKASSFEFPTLKESRAFVEELGQQQRRQETSKHNDHVERGEIDKAFFAQKYFAGNVSKQLIPEHHEVFKACDIRNQMVLISAFRYFGKTTLASFIDLIHKICYNLCEFIAIGSYNLTGAKQFTKAIKDQLETNLLLRQDFGDLVGTSQWQVGDFTTANGIRVLSVGAGTSLRGKIDLNTGVRPDCVVIDDLETDDSARSAYQSGNLIDWLFKGVYPALRAKKDGGAYFRIVGNPITPVSVISQLMKDDTRNMIKLIYPIIKEDGSPRWPELFSETEIERIKRDVKIVAFHSEYLLSPLSSEFQLFQEKWLIHEDVEKITDWDHTVAACDPSPTEFGDYKAIVVLSTRESDNRVYIRYVWCRKATVEDFLKALHNIQDMFDCPIAIEDNALKDFLAKTIKDYEKEHDIHLNYRPIHHSKKKAIRIENLQSPFERGLIVLPLLNHSDVQILVDQLLAYPTAKHDDGVDALSEGYAQSAKISRPPVMLVSPPKLPSTSPSPLLISSPK
jgi:predicted phage terminase large subunit-like protein